MTAVAGHDSHFARLASLEGPSLCVEAQAALLLFRTMTFEAMLLKEGLNFGRKVHRAGCSACDGNEEQTAPKQDGPAILHSMLIVIVRWTVHEAVLLYYSSATTWLVQLL